MHLVLNQLVEVEASNQLEVARIRANRWALCHEDLKSKHSMKQETEGGRKRQFDITKKREPIENKEADPEDQKDREVKMNETWSHETKKNEEEPSSLQHSSIASQQYTITAKEQASSIESKRHGDNALTNEETNIILKGGHRSARQEEIKQMEEKEDPSKPKKEKRPKEDPVLADEGDKLHEEKTERESEVDAEKLEGEDNDDTNTRRKNKRSNHPSSSGLSHLIRHRSFSRKKSPKGDKEESLEREMRKRGNTLDSERESQRETDEKPKEGSQPLAATIPRVKKVNNKMKKKGSWLALNIPKLPSRDYKRKSSLTEQQQVWMLDNLLSFYSCDWRSYCLINHVLFLAGSSFSSRT